MPVERQTVLVRTYCVACHRDAQKNGGLSLEKFDAGQADPGVVAMVVSKMKTGAFGAGGGGGCDCGVVEAGAGGGGVAGARGGAGCDGGDCADFGAIGFVPADARL